MTDEAYAKRITQKDYHQDSWLIVKTCAIDFDYLVEEKYEIDAESQNQGNILECVKITGQETDSFFSVVTQVDLSNQSILMVESIEWIVI